MKPIMNKWFWPHLGQFSCAAKKIVFWWETKSKDSLSTAAAAGGIRFKSSVSVFLFPPVCFGRDLCFGLNCQSANKQGHCGWVTGSKTSKLHKHWTKLAATVVSPFLFKVMILFDGDRIVTVAREVGWNRQSVQLWLTWRNNFKQWKGNVKRIRLTNTQNEKCLRRNL